MFEIGFGRALSAFLNCLEQNRRNIQLEIFEILVSPAHTVDGLPYLYGTATAIAGVARFPLEVSLSRFGVPPACDVESSLPVGRLSLGGTNA